LGDKKYTQSDFAKYLESRQTKSKKTDYKVLIENMYSGFVDQTCIAYEDSRLSTKYKEFRLLLDEYRDGILLFELTDKKVWSAAVKDSAGLAQFYEKNKNNYLWDERVEASVYTCKDAKIAEKVKKLIKKKKSDEEIVKEINKDSQLNLKVEDGKYLKGDNDVVDKVEWKSGLSNDITKDNQIVFVNIQKVIPKEPKSLNEAKGVVTADYQNFLENEWIDELRNKYQVTIDDVVLKSVK
jgi:peptidyl-prolyl cis-trans isomerase SurA